MSTPGKTRSKWPPLDELNELSAVSKVNGGTLRSVKRHSPFSSVKSFLFAVAFLLIAVAVFFGSVHQTPATQCVNHIDVESLHNELRRRVHGQHIAVNVVTRQLEDFNSALDRKQLVISFHGWTGIGKNYMSSIIAQYLPPTSVHKLIIPLHFPHGTENDAWLLSEWITSNTSSLSCGLHLFIVDEIDKAAATIVHSLHETLTELSRQSDTASRAVFLLLTNDGATEINSATTQVLMNGGCRDDLDYARLVPHLSSQWYTELVSADLIDEMVPFLPLERQHVVQCTETELKRRQVSVTQQLVDDIVNRLSYFPASLALFSSSGCRRIAQLVDLFI